MSFSAPQSWQRQPSRFSTSFLSKTYSSGFSLSLGCLRGRRIEIHWAVDSRTLRTALFKPGTCEKIRTDHLQAVTARFIGPQHQTGSFKGFLDHGQLALINLEVDNFPRLRFFAGQMPFDLSFKPLLGQFLGFVQPGCTIELFPIFPGHLDQFGRFAPTHLAKLLLWNLREVL